QESQRLELQTQVLGVDTGSCYERGRKRLMLIVVCGFEAALRTAQGEFACRKTGEFESSVVGRNHAQVLFCILCIGKRDASSPQWLASKRVHDGAGNSVAGFCCWLRFVSRSLTGLQHVSVYQRNCKNKDCGSRTTQESLEVHGVLRISDSCNLTFWLAATSMVCI